MNPGDDWTEAKRAVGKAYDRLLARGREDPSSLGPYGTMCLVRLPNGLECRVTIANAPPLPRTE